MTAPGLVAMLLQDAADARTASYSPTAVLVRMQTDWRDVRSSDVVIDEPSERGTHSFSVGQDHVMWTTVDVAMPGDDLAELASRSRLWPQGTPAPTEHARHTIVTVRPPDADDRADGADPVGRARLLSRTIASMIALDSTIRAVIWAPAQHLILPAAFRELAKDPDPAALMHAWVAFNVGPDHTGKRNGHTLGLGALGLMDAEILGIGDPGEITLLRLRGTAHTQLTQGQVIADGDTVGASDKERILVRHQPSTFGPPATVLRLESGGGRNRDGARRGLFRRG